MIYAYLIFHNNEKRTTKCDNRRGISSARKGEQRQQDRAGQDKRAEQDKRTEQDSAASFECIKNAIGNGHN